MVWLLVVVVVLAVMMEMRVLLWIIRTCRNGRHRQCMRQGVESMHAPSRESALLLVLPPAPGRPPHRVLTPTVNHATTGAHPMVVAAARRAQFIFVVVKHDFWSVIVASVI